MVSGPWNGAGLSRDSRPRRLALVRRKAASSLSCFSDRLVPFSMTWTVLGGAEWRLTFFAYAFYLVAAFWFVDKAVHVARAWLLSSEPRRWTQIPRRQILGRVATVLALVVVGIVWWIAVPYALTREAFRYDGAASIVAGPRDRWFFVDGWSTSLSREMSRCGLPRRLARLSESCCPRPARTRSRSRSDPVDPFRGGATDRACLIERNSPRRSRPRVESGTHRPVSDHGSEGMFTPGDQRLELRSDAAFKLWYVRISAL